MIFLFDYIKKVPEDAEYDVAIQTIHTAITSQTNQAMILFKLFTAMQQDQPPFFSWWAKIKEQANKCFF